MASSFEVIHGSLAALHADPALVALADRAIDDEHRLRPAGLAGVQAEGRLSGVG
ncbi:MAG: hypothetical protein IPM35_24735 [Myxococcales bacterium]|nr:hypothetical protein [Myxococcales bacterium]